MLQLSDLIALMAATKAPPGPQLQILPKAQSNVTPLSIGKAALNAPAMSDPAAMMTALVGAAGAPAEQELRRAQAAQAQRQADVLKQFNFDAITGGGAGGSGQTQSGAPASFGSLAPAGPTGGAASPLPAEGGAGSISDPRGVAPLIREGAARYGHDPDIAIKVVRAEGLGRFLGDGGKSGGAFQLYTGGGLGNEFQKETGLDPLDPKNEPATIDWALRNLSRTGWGPYHGAKLVGVGSRDGIDVGTPGNMPAVPNFAGRMVGNQGASYAPGGQAPPTQLAQAQIAPAASAPSFGSLAPGGAVPNAGMPPLAAAPGSAAININPLALAKQRAILGLGGISGDPLSGFAQAYYQSPQYLAAKAAAEKWAGVAPDLYTAQGKKQIDLGALPQELRVKQQFAYGDPQYNADLTQRLAAAKTVGEKQGVLLSAGIDPASPQGQQILGAGAAHAAGIDPFKGGERPTVPLLQYNPATGGYAIAQPPGYAQAAAGLAAATTGGAELGRAQVEYNPLNPQQPGVPPSQAAAGQAQELRGSRLAPDLTSTIPPIREPNLSPAELKSSIPEWTKMGNELPVAKDAAQQAEHRLLNIADAFKMVQSGAYLTQKADFDSLLKSIGLPPILTNDPAAVQLALHENYRSTLQNLGAANKRFTQNEFQIISENSTHPNLQPEANLSMLAEDIGSLRQIQGIASDWRVAQLAGAHNIDAFRTDWLNANPLNKVSDAVKQEIGPLKGMSASSTAAPPAPPTVGEVRDGHKYNGGNPGDPNSWKRAE